MKHFTFFLFCLSLIVLNSCKHENQNGEDENTRQNKVVLISVNAPEKYIHPIKEDSLGKILKDSLGPIMEFQNNGFTYLDYLNNVQTWLPRPDVADTLVIECYTEYLELSTKNFFTAINETFLVKRGDTVVFNYEYGLPKADITNRAFNDVELNYNRNRLRKLFDNKYTSHHLILLNLFFNESITDYEQRSIDYYFAAKNDYDRELEFLDSLRDGNLISQTNYNYRKDALNMLMERHKKLNNIKNWLEQNNSSIELEAKEKPFGFDLTQTDSMMKYSFFRDYLNIISEYDLPLIEENNGNSGGFYADSRIRFDSILNDRRFNQTAKNFLLFNAFYGIGQNYQVKDKEKYFKKLQSYTTNREQLDRLQKIYNLDFKKSDDLILTNIINDTITFSELLKNNKGKWLYMIFGQVGVNLVGLPCQNRKSLERNLKRKMLISFT